MSEKQEVRKTQGGNLKSRVEKGNENNIRIRQHGNENKNGVNTMLQNPPPPPPPRHPKGKNKGK